MTRFRIGFGYDIHRLERGRTLTLGGVRIAEDVGCVAHSDGDVLLHAVCDALLGAAALGDIGLHFPDTDESYRGISSLLLLERCTDLLKAHGCAVANIDATVILERPRLRPHVEAMREAIARAAGISPEAVSVKATTAEGLGPAGAGEAVEAHAVALVERAGTDA
jgi:2-C-methyl-D-erythritol 2,4-cyclodiphosphate synthase